MSESFDPAVLRARSGPRGGIDADPFRAGFVLVAVMLDGARANIAYRVWRTWLIAHEGSVLSGWGDNLRGKLTPCELTTAPLFGDALKIILGNEDLARRVNKLRVSDSQLAEIWFDNDKVSRFQQRTLRPHLLRTAELDGLIVRGIASTLKHQ